MQPLRLLPLLAALLLPLASFRADDWPQWLGPQRDGVWRESGIVDRLPATPAKVRWRTPVGAGYSGPAVAQGRVYLTDRQLAPTAANPSNPFARGEIPGTERVLCLDDRDGRLLWSHRYEATYTVSYPAGPRATPIVHDGRVYTLGAEGHLYCLDAAKGDVIWSRILPRDFDTKTPLWGFAGHPLIDGDRLICLVGGKGSVAVAFDRHTGKELWRALDAKEPGYAPPMIYTFGNRRQLILWHPEAVNALDPATGATLWSFPLEARSGLSVSTPRQDGDRLFLTSFYNGSLLLRVHPGDPTPVWQSKKVSEKDTDGLHSIMPTPFLVDGHLYGICSYGQFRCLKLETGDRLWESFEPTGGREVRWGNAFLVRHEDRFFAFSEKGDLILLRINPQRYEELGRLRLLEPTNQAAGRDVVWSHPAYANRSVYARNDLEIVAVSLARD